MRGLDWVDFWRHHFDPVFKMLWGFGLFFHMGVFFFFFFLLCSFIFFKASPLGSVSDTHGSDVAGQSSGVTLFVGVLQQMILLGAGFLYFYFFQR